MPLTRLTVLATLMLQAQPAVPPSSQLGVFVYPAKGQSPQQQQADESECYAWAHTQTGIDPTAAAPKVAPQSQGADGSAVKGAAGGALAGTAIGAIAGDTGEGAAIGAVAGAVRGRRKAKAQHKQENQQAQQQAQAQTQQAKATFGKAYAACLEGKGYTAK